MVQMKLFVCNIIIWLMTSSELFRSIRAEEKLNNSQIDFNKFQNLKIFPGIKFSLKDGEIIVNVRIYDLLLQETKVQARKDEEKSPLQRFGFMMMMTPFVMQILSLPGAIATIKISLLRSLMVAQLAIAIMIYNFIYERTQNEQVVVVHHAHYYDNHHYPQDDEDEWLGK